MKINKTDKIKAHTAIYVRNGKWTQYFQKDSATGELIAITPIPRNCSTWMLTRVPNGATYNDLHEKNSIAIYKDDLDQTDLYHFVDDVDLIKFYPIKSLDGNSLDQPQIKLFDTTSLYTDGQSIFKTTDDSPKIVADSKTLNKCKIVMINDITQKETTMVVNQLNPIYSEQMCKIMYNLKTNGNAHEKLYIRISETYNKDVKRLTDAGELINALNTKSHKSFFQLLKKTLTTLNNDTQIESLFELIDNNSKLVITGQLNHNRKSNTKEYSIHEIKDLVSKIWYNNYLNTKYKKQYKNENIWTLSDCLAYIVKYKI